MSTARAALGSSTEQPCSGAPAVKVLTMAGWFGLLTGLVEGAALLGMQRVGWLTWEFAQMGVSAEILWIAPIFNLLVFLAVGVALTALARIRPNEAPVAALFVFAFLMASNWLMLLGRLRHSAVLILAAGLAAAVMRAMRRREHVFARLVRTTLPGVGGLAVLVLAGVQGLAFTRERMAVAQLPPAAAGSPNIVIIVIDTLRADHLSSYGYARHTSPNIDRIAEQGVAFDHAFASSSWTLPSHASLLTGRHPHEHGVETAEQPIPDRHTTLPEVLQTRGYRTGAFSANTFFFSRAMNFGRGFMRFEDYFGTAADMAARTVFGRKFHWFLMRRLGHEDIPGRKLAEDVNQAMLRWIDGYRERPFFAFLNYFDTHDPYLPPQPYRRKFSKQTSPGGVINSFLLRDYPRMSPEQLQGEIDAYDGAVAYVDEQVGWLMRELTRRGLDQNTVVIVTSDHGESFGEHGLLGHRNALYREVIEVPLVFWCPGQIPAGVRVATPISNTQLAATVIDLLGDGDSQLFAGPSLTPLWKESGRDVAWPTPLAELARMPFEVMKPNPSYSGWLKSLVTREWHYIVHEKNGPELYRWKRDRDERNNLANTPEGREVVRQFEETLRAVLRVRSQNSAISRTAAHRTRGK